MREYDFRGKRVDNGEWVYGCLVVTWVSGVYIVGTHLQGKCDVNNVKVGEKFVHSEVVPETVGQFTGRKYDDKTDIYEGDILNAKDTLVLGFPNGTYKVKVEWQDIEAGFWLICIGETGGIPFDEVSSYTKLGDIHSNPELLEER